jgi:hypothetical protein
MLVVPDGSPRGLADQFEQPPLALDQRESAQVTAVLLQEIEGVQHRFAAPTLAAQRTEVIRPMSPMITASPSISKEAALMRSAASTMEGKQSGQSSPLRVKQRTREPSRRTINR